MGGAGVRRFIGLAVVLAIATLPLSSVGLQPSPSVPAAKDLPAPTFVPFTPNVLVNTGLLGYDHQVEPTMAINSQGRIFVGWKEAFTASGGGQRVAFSYSTDNGTTWAPNILMPVATLTRQSDPWLSLAPDETAYFTRIEYNGTGTYGGISVSATVDGEVWGPTRFYSDAPNFADKESAAVDANGDLLWVWNMDMTTSPWRQDLAFARSSDGGTTWSPKVLVNDQEGTIGGFVAAHPNDTVLATWWGYNRDDILFDRSFDGGATWGPDVPVNDIPGMAYDPNGSDWVFPLPAMAVSPNGTIYVVWLDPRNGNFDIMFSRSSDGGTTWSPNLQLNDDATTARQWMPDLALDPYGGVHVAWMDDRLGEHNVFYVNSTDGGTTWGPNVRVSDVGTSVSFSRPGDYLALESDAEGNIAVVWTDGRSWTDLDIYFARLPRTVAYTVDTNPTGLQVLVDGQAYLAPHTFEWKTGDTHSLSAPSPQPVGPQTRFGFATWSDGGAATHDVIVGPSDGSVLGTFALEHEVSLATSPTPLEVLVDGNPTIGGGVWWWEDASDHTLEIPSPQDVAAGTHYAFDRWTDGGPTNRTVTVSGPSAYEAVFRLEHLLTLISPHGTVSGAGWYPAGAAATFLVGPPIVSGTTGTRYVFTGWTGDVTTAATVGVVSMDAPKTVTAEWGTEHELTTTSARGTPTGTGWYAADTLAPFSVSPATVDGATGTRYVFLGWSGDSAAIDASSELLMDAPKAVTAEWRTEHRLTIESLYGNPVGAGWHGEGTTVPVSIEARVTVNGTTYRFAGWTGDGTGADPSVNVTMDAPKTLRALWEEVAEEPPARSTLDWSVWLVILTVAFFLLALFFWRRRRKRDEQIPTAKPEDAPPPT